MRDDRRVPTDPRRGESIYRQCHRFGMRVRQQWPTPTHRDTARWQHCERLRYEADLEPPRQLGARRHMRRGGY